MSSRMDISPLFLSGGWSFFPEQLANASDFALSTLAIIAFPGKIRNEGGRKSIFPQKCQKIRGETTDCMMNSEGLKQGLKAFLTEFATCSKTGLPENMIDIIFLEVLL